MLIHALEILNLVIRFKFVGVPKVFHDGNYGKMQETLPNTLKNQCITNLLNRIKVDILIEH